MTSPAQMVKSIGPKLVPFFKSVAIYFVLSGRIESQSWLQVAVKCSPIFSLIIFILLYGMSFGAQHTYARRILLGLVFSSIGDALLVWPDYFLHGMVAFSIAHIIYSVAFGFRPLNLPFGAVLYCASFVVDCYLVNSVKGLLVIFIPVYSILITTMLWRAISRVRLFEELWSWSKLCACIGGVLFTISDTILSFNKFYSPIPHAGILIMVTYYAAQLGITLSVVDSKDCRTQIKRRKSTPRLYD